MRFRDEKGALESAKRACEVTNWQDHRHVGTLAAVHARTGDFTNAVKYQKMAIGLVVDEGSVRSQLAHDARLGLYESGRSYTGANPYNLSAGRIVARWDFEQSSGRTVEEASGNGSDGLLVGDAHIINDPNGKGRVLCLDGDQDWVNCGNDARFDITSEITVACWIKVNRFERWYKTIVSKGDRAWRLSRDRDLDQLHFACSGKPYPDMPWPSLRGEISVNDGKWHHVAGVYDGARISLYIDGVLDVSSPFFGEIGTNDCNVLIGANEEMTEPDRSFDGLIDDMRIYDYALAETEVRELYERGRFVPNEN
jgi:hypothetical protein